MPLLHRSRLVPLIVCLFGLACGPSSTTDAGTDVATDASSSDATADAGFDVQPIMAITSSGTVVGRDFGAYQSFFGIPYAASPSGPRRWVPPVAPAAWTTPRDASAIGSACPQAGGSQNPNSTDEDCLFVNVWTPPHVTAGANVPVMVFIHGGGFTAGHGGNPLFDGAQLAQHGVIVVTMNYRLGQLGFLAHPALEAEDTVNHSAGNYGFLDQVFALHWVHDNIAAFGGNAANVTIFGESAGAISVCGHLVSPLSSGLFQRAITESGSCALIFEPLHDDATTPNASADSLGHRVATALGCETVSDVAACLRGKSVQDVLAAVPVSLDIHFSGAHYMPNVDGYVFPRSPWNMLNSSTTMLNATQIMGGANHDEGTGFTLTSPITTDADFRALIATVFPDHVPDAVALYPTSSYPTVNDAANAFIGDAIFICPARAVARQIAAHDPHSYLYFFTRVNNFGRTLHLGAFHGGELPYVFGNFVNPFTPSMADSALSDVMMGYWSRFATTGDPNGAGAWPAYAGASDTYLELGDVVASHTALHAATCDAIEPWIAAR